MKKIRLYRYVYGFSVNYDSVDVQTMKDNQIMKIGQLIDITRKTFF